MKLIAFAVLLFVVGTKAYSSTTWTDSLISTVGTILESLLGPLGTLLGLIIESVRQKLATIVDVVAYLLRGEIE